MYTNEVLTEIFRGIHTIMKSPFFDYTRELIMILASMQGIK